MLKSLRPSFQGDDQAEIDDEGDDGDNKGDYSDSGGENDNINNNKND